MILRAKSYENFEPRFLVNAVRHLIKSQGSKYDNGKDTPDAPYPFFLLKNPTCFLKHVGFFCHAISIFRLLSFY